MSEVLFVGREREQEVYKNFLARETPWVLIITGLGGIGKTTLLHRLAQYTLSEATLLKTGVVTLDFANEELRNDPLKLLDKLTTDTAPYCDLQQIDSGFKNELLESLDQLAQLSRARAQTGTSDSDDLALREIRHQMRELATEAFYLQIKTNKLDRLVMMLDTCEWLSEPEGIEVGQWVLNELIPEMHARIRQKGRQCPVVIFSRLQPRLDVINGQDQRRLTLPMFGKAEVDQYLEHMGMHDADLRQRVYEVTYGHALCVSIIGDFWQQREAQKESFTLADLPELQIQEFSEIALMRFTNERVLRQLKSPFKDLTQYGVLLRSFDLPLLRAVFPELLPEPEALERFDQLIRYPYIESRGNYRYAFHELLREALAEVTQREGPEEWKGYHKRALDYLAEVSPHSPDWYYHLLAYDEKQGLEAWQQAIQEARESGKREYNGALLQAALDKALKLSLEAHAEIKYEEGRFNYYGVQWEEALRSYKEALAFFKEVEDLSGYANCYQAIGDVQRALGNLEDALESYEKARAFYQQLGDQFGEAKCCQALGDVQRLRNDLDAALRSYEQALTLCQEEKDRLRRAKVLKAMGDVQQLRQERNAALESYGQALALYGELKEPAEEASVRQAVEEVQRPVRATPQPPSYISETQLPIYVHSSNAQYGQQPLYTPTQQPYNPPPTQPQKRSPVRTIVLAVIAFVLILGGLGSFFLYQNNQNQQQSEATATAHTQANNTATATAFASANGTAVVLVTLRYPPFTKLSFHDPLNTSRNSNWSSTTACQPSSNGLQVSIVHVNTFEYCTYLPGTFGEFAFQATMNIQQGDCGGLIFRHIDAQNMFLYEVCQNGTYNLSIRVNNQWSSLYTNNHPRAAIQQGLNMQNVLAVTVQGDTINMYVNGQNVDTVTNSDLTGNKFAQGSIALVADDINNPTTVIYTDALVWTL